MDRRLKILLMMKYIIRSGASKIFLWLAEALAERGHEVKVLTFRDKMQSFDVPNGLQWERFNLTKNGTYTRVKKIREVIKEFQPDVSISFLLDANVYNILACLGLPTKTVVCERNDPFKPHYYALRFWKPLFRFADGAVFQLSKVKEYYSNIKGLTAVIPNPMINRAQVELEPISERKDTFVAHGRLELFQKRQDVLIDAFKTFHEHYPQYKLLIYGDGPDEQKIRQQIDTLGLNDSVILMGAKDNMEQHLSKSKFYTFSSDFEGMPNALIEAMALGLPCVATDCRPGGAAFLIEDGKNGFLVPKGDADKLCERMLYLAEHLDEAEQMGQEAAKICDKLEPEHIAKLWGEYLYALMKEE